MGSRVHVVKRQPEYGRCGFNWKSEEFKSFLDDMGCETTGESYDDDFDCDVCLFKKAVWALSIYVHRKPSDARRKNPYKNKARWTRYDKFLDFLDERGTTVGEFEDGVCSMADLDDKAKAAKESLETMVGMLVDRDKSSSYISFSTF